MLLITHDQTFHYDEVLATAFLLQIYKNANIVRTRDQEIIDQGDIVYDVGHVFDPKKMRFDHHMASFTETFSDEYEIKLSSSGLIYKYFYEKVFEKRGLKKTDLMYEKIVKKVYEEFFLWADAVDNGYDLEEKIKSRNIADLVAMYNQDTQKKDKQDDYFEKALLVVKLI